MHVYAIKSKYAIYIFYMYLKASYVYMFANFYFRNAVDILVCQD